MLVYHRLADGAAPSDGLVPTVSAEQFSRHLAALLRVAHVVPLASLVTDERPRQAGRRPRVAVTFDDDDAAHATLAVPLLARAGVPATFFLSGRALAGLGPYWFVRLEHAVRRHGLSEVARWLGVAADTPAALAACCEASPDCIRALMRLAVPGPSASVPSGDAVDGTMDAEAIRIIATAGHTVGFHTLDHPVLPRLTDAALAAALTEGRAALETATGAPVRLVAYPHGRADRRVAEAARAAGFAAGFVTGGRPIAPDAPRYLLGRWEPGAIDTDALVDGLTLRLHRAPA